MDDGSMLEPTRFGRSELGSYSKSAFFLRCLDSVQTQMDELIKSKIATPKDPKVFRRDLNLRCAMKASSPELGTL
jgi:hypothetical protein